MFQTTDQHLQHLFQLDHPLHGQQRFLSTPKHQEIPKQSRGCDANCQGSRCSCGTWGWVKSLSRLYDALWVTQTSCHCGCSSHNSPDSIGQVLTYPQFFSARALESCGTGDLVEESEPQKTTRHKCLSQVETQTLLSLLCLFPVFFLSPEQKHLTSCQDGPKKLPSDKNILFSPQCPGYSDGGISPQAIQTLEQKIPSLPTCCTATSAYARSQPCKGNKGV